MLYRKSYVKGDSIMQEHLTSEKSIFSAKGDTNAEFDFTLPEYLPNMSRIIKTDVTEEKCTFSAENSPHITVNLKIEVLYVSDFGEKIKNATFHESVNVPFDGKMDTEDDFSVTSETKVTRESSKPITSRKIHTSVSLNASVCVSRKVQKEIFDANEKEGFHALCKSVEVCEKSTIAENYFEMQKELTIDDRKPGIGDIIQAKAVFGSSKCSVNDGKAEFESTLIVHLLYETTPSENNDGEVGYETVSVEMPIRETLELDSVENNAVCLIKAKVNSTDASVTFDPYGESRTVSVSVKYTLFGTLYQKKSLQICLDAFCESCESVPQSSEETVECIKETISDSIHLEESVRADIHEISEISDCVCTVVSTSYELSEGKFFASAKCSLKILGTTAQGEPVAFDVGTTLKIPLNTSSEISDSVPEISASIAKIQAKIKEGELYFDFDIDIFGVILSKRVLTFISDIVRNEESVDQKKESEIIIYYPSNDDTIWSISKKYRINPEKLKKANNIEDENLLSKHCVLIP